MITQKEWVEGCYAYYAENHYEINNPEDGEWHDAHYPVPKCKYGTETIPLLKQHHAIQGVLQSEEYQCPCIWGWEAPYLYGETLVLYRKWKSENGRAWALGGNAARRTPVRITYPDGRVCVTESVGAAATMLNLNRHRVKKILNRENNYLHTGIGRAAVSTGIRIEYA